MNGYASWTATKLVVMKAMARGNASSMATTAAAFAVVVADPMLVRQRDLRQRGTVLRDQT